VKYYKRINKAIKILNTKIPTDPYKMAIFPVGILYSLQKSKNPYRRDFSLQVATLAKVVCQPGLPDQLFANGPNLVQKEPKKSQILRHGTKKRANHFFQIYQQLQSNMNP